jgi:hypothetical protein
MRHARTLAICALGIVCAPHAVVGQGFSQYRSFELGSDVASVSALAGIPASEAKTIHQRPAVLQDLEWGLSRWLPGSSAPSTDPVERILFSFYNDQLFQVVVDYGRDRTEGLTGTDMIEAISAVYGAALPRTTRPPVPAASRLEVESGSLVARWGNADHTIILYQRASSGTSFRLIATEVRLAGLARKAESQAFTLDDREAPQREIARQQKERDDRSSAAAKARAANKPGFRP